MTRLVRSHPVRSPELASSRRDGDVCTRDRAGRGAPVGHLSVCAGGTGKIETTNLSVTHSYTVTHWGRPRPPAAPESRAHSR
eukprot:scaffold39278_cov59-Phaeocystis_antarctica.AAC.1